MPDAGINQTALVGAIKSIVDNNKILKTIDSTALDSFGSTIIGSKESKTINLSVYGAIFSRINANLGDHSVTVG
mgnify:CR=1 FL=1